MPAIVAAAIGGGVAIYGAHKAASSQEKAAEVANQGIEKGIALQKEMYEQDRADMAPYRAIGAGGLGNLAYLGGITIPAPSSSAPGALSSLAVPSETAVSRPVPNRTPIAPEVLTNMGDRSRAIEAGTAGPTRTPVRSQVFDNLLAAGMVRVRSPRGTIGVIPASMLPHALAAGGTEVV